jgi:hypothetical protein
MLPLLAAVFFGCEDPAAGYWKNGKINEDKRTSFHALNIILPEIRSKKIR